VAKHTEGIFPLCLARRGRKAELKKCVGEAIQQLLWGKPGTAPPWRNWEQAETDSLTKRKVHFYLTGLPCEWKGQSFTNPSWDF
jgi:hypothetical protein